MGVCLTIVSPPTPAPSGAFDILEKLPGCKDPALPCFLVAGHHTTERQEELQPKPTKQRGTRGFEELGQTVGFVCRKGRKADDGPQYCQDDFNITKVGGAALYGVYDGHGAAGHDIASYVAGRILRNLVCDPSYSSHLEAALRTAFMKTQKDCELLHQKQQLPLDLSGTTATLLVDRQDGKGGHRELCIAHVGDSRAVLGYYGKDPEGAAGAGGGAKLLAMDLTRDHRPELEGERARIYQAGGVVREAKGEPTRVFLKDRNYPGLAMSRSIGDMIATSCGVTGEPDVATLRVEGSWRFVLICSDGVWEFITSQEAVDIVGKYPASEVQKATDKLCATAAMRWLKEEDGEVVDDITAICLWLAP